MKRKGKEKNGKEKKRREKEKRKECWGSEVSGGSRGFAAAVGCTYTCTDERTVCKDTYLPTLRRCSCDGRVGVY